MGCSLGIDGVFAKLESFTQHPNHKYWEDGSLQVESPVWKKVTGHSQVTDTNLLLIARRHGGSLATFDEAIKNRLSKDRQVWVQVIL